VRDVQLRHRFQQRGLPLVIFCAILLAVFPAPRLAFAQEVPELKINSKRYIVIDAETGEIFAQRGAHDQAAMASLTKIFTAIEAIEAGSPDLQITTSEADLVSPDNSMMGFDPGETFSLEDLLYGLMLPSGNDAANAIARSLGAQPGDSSEQAVQRFVDRMNTRLANMGLTNTNLVNPSGWGVPNHYSSAHDLAVFTMYALQYPRFVELISTLEHDTATGGYHLRNNNRLMTMYPSLLGGKTGFDYDAGWCLIEVARRDGSTMISVTMDGVHPDDWYDDNRVLLEYAFEQKAARLAARAPISSQVVSFRDPDAAIIAEVATAGGSIGSAAPAAGPDRTMAIAAEPAAIAQRDLGDPQTLVQGQTQLNLRLLSAFIVATVILAGRAMFTFAQPIRSAAGVGSLPVRSRRLVRPQLGLKLARSGRKSDSPV
jgi:D-alanyl-D-alanine carboxypeptidase (penicillin-binding protein 5/6)